MSLHLKKLIVKVFAIASVFLCASFSTNFDPGFGVKVVVIDAGHGGKDPGCHGLKYQEKDIALAVALKLGRYIEDNFKDVKVVYTRNTDVFVELQERAAIANRNKADLFISIHCNSASYKDPKTKKIIENPSACGSETYVMGIKNEKGKLDIAKRENSAMLLEDNYIKKYDGFDPNSDEAYIIMSLYTDTYLDQSLDLSSKIQKQYKKSSRVDKGVRRASLWVLWRTYMPSLLTEIGFLTNAEEELFLGSEKGQNDIASSIFRAFRQYKNDIEGVKTSYNEEIIEKPKTIDSIKSVVVIKTPTVIVTEEPKKDTVPVNKPLPIKEEPKKTEVVDSLRIKRLKNIIKRDSTIKPITTNKDTLKKSTETIYKVQIVSSDKSLPANSEQFKGLQNVFEYIENNRYKYAVGSYTTYEKATEFQLDLRKKGFSDAFVIALKDGKRIPINNTTKSIKR